MSIWKIIISKKFSRKTLKTFQCELLRKWPLSGYLFTQVISELNETLWNVVYSRLSLKLSAMQPQ